MDVSSVNGQLCLLRTLVLTILAERPDRSRVVGEVLAMVERAGLPARTPEAAAAYRAEVLRFANDLRQA